MLHAADQNLESPPRALASEIGLPGLRARLLPRQSYRANFTAERLVIGFAFDIQQGEHAFASDRRRPFATRPATMAVTRPGCEVFSASMGGGEYLTLEIAGPEALGLASPKPGGPPARSNLTAPGADRPAKRLRAWLLAGGRDDVAAAEAALDLAVAAMAAADGTVLAAGRSAASLTDRRLKRLDALIEDRLGGPLSIAEMAEALALSPRFFLRAFRAATGTTPHAYLLERRLEAARCALAKGREPIAAIAAASGFSSQAHLDSAFRRAFGLTPSAFRSAHS